MDQAEIDARFVAQWRGLERLLGLLEVDEAAGTVRAANLRFFYLASDVEAAKTIAALVFSSPEGQARRVKRENGHPSRTVTVILAPALTRTRTKARRVAWENEFLTLLNPAGATGLEADTPPLESTRLTLAAVAGTILPTSG